MPKTINIALIGACGVGKSATMHQFISGEFGRDLGNEVCGSEDCGNTLHFNYQVPGGWVEVHVEEFDISFLDEVKLDGYDGIIGMFSVLSEDSADDLKDALYEHVPRHLLFKDKVVVLANKADCPKHAVSARELAYYDRMGIRSSYHSAKENTDLSWVIEHLTQLS